MKITITRFITYQTRSSVLRALSSSGCIIPALLNMISSLPIIISAIYIFHNNLTLPKVSTVFSTKAFTWSSFDTSSLKAIAEPEPASSVIFVTAFWTPASFKSAHTTLAPSLANRAAVSNPIPLSKDVTNETIPSVFLFLPCSSSYDCYLSWKSSTSHFCCFYIKYKR